MLRIPILMAGCLLALLSSGQPVLSQKGVSPIDSQFVNPPKDCWPHTRWWWPGNAGSKEEITRELEQMRSHGIRGVEQITMESYYEKGNQPYLSDGYMELIRHTVKEAKRLDMEVSLNFGGPGWIIGGAFVPEEEKSKDLVPTYADLSGPLLFQGKLPDKLTKTKRSWEVYKPALDGDETLIAVLAAEIAPTGRLKEETLINLTQTVHNNQIRWEVPKGNWKLMAFWLKKNGLGNAVDHFNKKAMAHYCDFLGNQFYAAVGDEFGKTVESLFVDSFELPNLASGLNWSTGLFEDFQKRYGYDLIPCLPAVWYDMGDKSARIRYDVNEFLHTTGLNAFYDTFLGWCDAHQIKGRIQTYGFNSDNIESAGKAHIPEMEITAGEKDQADWFDTRIGPKKYVSSGAHLYGREVVSTEAYTFIHWERYRETMEELKIASDGYLLSGATKFYNHGFNFLPEQEVSPSRSIPFAAYIQPQNIWWKHYPNLAQYIARCSYLLRQGSFCADIALYSPLANQWAINAINPRKWTREFEWGELGGLIVSNGYDYDLVNDDILQNHSSVENGELLAGLMRYKMLIVPNVETLPLKTLQCMANYARSGGTLIFLERIPEKSTGLRDGDQGDAGVRKLAGELFGEKSANEANPANLYGIREARTDPAKGIAYGQGKVYRINNVLDRTIWWNKQSSAFDPFLKILRNRIAPDLGIPFAKEGMRKNEGLTYLHRKIGTKDLYFVANIQDRACNMPVTFRTHHQIIRRWNPYNGTTEAVLAFETDPDGITLPVRLAPYESTFFEFTEGQTELHVTKTMFPQILSLDNRKLRVLAAANGTFQTTLQRGSGSKVYETQVKGLPGIFSISGKWQLELKGDDFPGYKTLTDNLFSWSDKDSTRQFSGTGHYALDFDLPEEYLSPGLRLYLDPGRVGNVALVKINGKEVATLWMRGQSPDVTQALKKGRNHLEIEVTNTLINRIAAMREPKPVPDDMVAQYGSGDKSTGQPREFGFGPLPAAGLLGPVQLVPYKEMEIPL
ncbi:MAG: hypothetical protein LWW85_04815 [Marinilabiliales bacterium]|nr:hypothetical protein [Marinilabiliales bacterium]